MLNKTLSIIILVSMVLHCSSRLGVLSYIYRNKTKIAHLVGVGEKPIASCDSHYFINQNINISVDEDDAPITIVQAQEIVLFCSTVSNHFPTQPFTFLAPNETLYLSVFHPVHQPDVFHPPTII